MTLAAVGSRSFAHLQAVFLALLVGWIGLAVLLSRPGPAAWLRS